MMEGGLAKGKTREYATQGLGREMWTVATKTMRFYFFIFMMYFYLKLN